MRTKFIIVAMVIALLAMPFSQAQVTDPGPDIFDTSTGVPVTGETYTLSAKITDPDGVDTVRFYVYFKIGNDITIPEYPPVSKLSGNNYQSYPSVPSNASVIYYAIWAGDGLDNWNVTDVMEKDVEDNISPTAIYPSSVTINMGQPYSFNGSGSSDNVGIENYSWTFTYGGAVKTLYGKEPAFNFTIVGRYSITLAVADAWNNRDTLIFTIIANDYQDPVADPGIDIFVVIGQVAVLDASDSMDNAGIEKYTWTFSHNDTMVTLTGEIQAYRFWTAGDYNVVLEVEDSAGNTNQSNLIVHVLKDPNAAGETPWWTIALMGMVLAVIVTAILILKGSDK